MFPQAEHLTEIAALETVRLGETPFPLLLVAHQAAESHGLLIARRGAIEKRVVLEGGSPVDCRSNLAHETFSRFLAARGRMTEAEAHAALGRSVAKGVLLGELLTSEGVMDATELQRLLQQSLARKLFDLFTWREGEIEFAAGSFPTAAALKVKVPRLVLTGIERFVPQETIDAAVAPHAGTLFARHPEAAALAEDLRPTEKERGLLAALETPRRIEELLPLVGLPLAEVSRELWGLAMLGLVIAADRLPALGRRATPSPDPPTEAPTESLIAPPSAPVETSQRSVAPARGASPESANASSPVVAEAAALRQQVAERFSKLRTLDPFALLDIDERADGETIRLRYFTFAQRFAPWQFETPELLAAKPAAEEIFAAGAQAFARLADPRERERLRAARTSAPSPTAPAPPPTPEASAQRAEPKPAAPPPLSPPGATHRTAGPTPASFRIQTDLLDPEVQFKKGRALKEAQKWSAAVQQFDFAADCDPQNGLYLAEAAHCRFLSAPGSAGPKVLAQLREAQRIDPEAVTPYLYAGEIAAELGRFDEAETYLRAAAKRLGPNDRRALDALRDLARRRKK